MNWDQVEGNWKQFVGKVKAQWGDLTDDDLARAKGSREQFEGVIQERYGDTKEQVREKVNKFLDGI
jgi:uncharacterized protein YjbJ (UPF0337 family)